MTADARQTTRASETLVTGSPKRILFLLHYPGYLRYFDSIVRLLAEQRHHIDVLFDSPHKQAEGLKALDGASGDILVRDRAPVRRDVWGPVGRTVRGTLDYVRYLDPRMADAPYLRDRMRNAVPPVFRFLTRYDTLSAGMTRRLIRFFSMCERAIPSSRAIEDYLARLKPDLLVVSPLVTDRSPQVNYVKGAKALGIRTALCVASWDHLTTKGLMRVQPDLVAVWNDRQKQEAEEFQDVDPVRICVTGAHPWDRWFDRDPSSSRAAFCARVGLRSDMPFVMFAGSTASISTPDAEVTFVRAWIRAVRQTGSRQLRDIGLLIRPHPYNSAHWRGVDLSGVENAAIFPRDGANPVDERDRTDYFDSLHHSAAVVGINTSAMIEAAIVGRPILSVLDSSFSETQTGTLHFRYLLPDNGGCLQTATSLDDHVKQLADAVASPDRHRELTRAFVRTFVRPHGLDVAGTPVLASALARLASRGCSAPERMPIRLYALRFAMWGLGCLVVYSDLDRLQRRVRKAVSDQRRRFRYLVKRRHKARKARARAREKAA